MSYLILMILILVPSWIVSSTFNRRIKKYSKMPLEGGRSGREVAEKMLHENGIYDVKIQLASGLLSDHYNPQNRTVNLSPEVYNGTSVASAAVAAHECGHAVQHVHAYAPLQLRSALVPIVTFSSRLVTFIILGGILLLNVFPQLMLAGILLFAVTTIFSFITLPVEFDASKRAVAWLSSTRLTTNEQHGYVKDALKWAAMTYVIAALGALMTLVYYILIFMGRRD